MYGHINLAHTGHTHPAKLTNLYNIHYSTSTLTIVAGWDTPQTLWLTSPSTADGHPMNSAKI